MNLRGTRVMQVRMRAFAPCPERHRQPLMRQISISTLDGIPLIRAGDDLAAIILTAARDNGLVFSDGDILVVAQKIVSKAEGRLVPLATVEPGEEARALALRTDKDPRLVQLILDETDTVLREKPGVLIVRHRLGHVGANAGIDQSNIEHDDGEAALLLPRDPDKSAERLHQAIGTATGCHVGVLIADSLNRPWRLGTVGGAIGCAGFEVLDDRRGQHDLFGRELKVTMINRADSIAALATLLMGESIERTPAALVHGLPRDERTGRAADIMRPLVDDLFR
jgi:coenzyme F420-0:L-glutamate ligase / coenzyme F420-1:gamma-L-glutamate ligase